MKKIATLCLVLSATSFAASKKAAPKNNKPAATGTTVIARFNTLEASYAKLVETENQEFEKLAANAQNMEQQLQEKQALKANIEEKIAKIETMSDTKVYKEQYGEIVKEYKNVVKALDTEIAKLSKAVENFKAVESLKGGN